MKTNFKVFKNCLILLLIFQAILSFGQIDCIDDESNILNECEFTNECVNILCFDDCNNLTPALDYQFTIPYYFAGETACHSVIVENVGGNKWISLISTVPVDGELRGTSFPARLNNAPFNNCKLTLKFDTWNCLVGLGTPIPSYVEVWGSEVLPCRYDDIGNNYNCANVNYNCGNGDNYVPVCIGSAIVPSTGSTTHTMIINTADIPFELNYLLFVYNTDPTCAGLDNFSLIPDCSVEAGFTYLDDICSELVFTPDATGDRVTHTWSFGDGSPNSTLESPTHVYAISGVYSVTHTVVDNCGNSNSETILVIVTCCRPAEQAIVLNGSISPVNLSAIIGTILPSGSVTGVDIYLQGNFNIDVSYTFTDCNWVCEPGSEIRVQSGSTTIFNGCDLRACSQMWKGIKVNGGGNLIFRNSIERDAQYGISLDNNSSLTCNGNTFDRCFVGIYSAVFGSLKTITNYIDNNTFSCTNLLRPAYPGQSNYPSGFVLPNIPPRITFAGVWMNDVSASNVGLYGGAGNTFTGIRNGIITRGGTISAGGNDFIDLKGYNNNGTTLDWSGMGMYNNLTLNTVIYDNTTTNVYKSLRYNNSINSINTIYANDFSTRSSIIGKAIEASWGTNDKYDIDDNIIHSNNGISIYGSTTNSSVITDNFIDNAGYYYSGSSYAIYLSDLPSPVDITLTGNDISILNHYFTGILAQNTSKVLFENNIINNDHKEFGAFAHINNCTNSNFNINVFSSSLSTLANNAPGFYMSGSTGIGLCCNNMNRTEHGIVAVGSNPGTSLKSNTVTDCALYSIVLDDADIDVQNHEGNRWLGSNTKGQIYAGFASQTTIATNSQFIVNKPQNIDFEPDVVPPAVTSIWFLNATDKLDELCVEERCKISKGFKENELEVRNCNEEFAKYIDIANGIALESVYEDQYRWSSQLYLYELLDNDSLPGWQQCPELLEFYQNAPDRLSQYYSVGRKLYNMKFNPDNLTGQIDELQGNITGLVTSINNLYAEYPDTALTYAYYDQVLEMTTALTSEMQSLEAINAEVTNIIKERATTIMEEALALEETLSFHNANKRIYYYKAKLVRDGQESLSEEAWQEIRAISKLCPLEYGGPVYEAHGLLNDYLGEATSPLTLEACNGEVEQRRPAEQKTEIALGISIFPNPTSGIWQIKVDTEQKGASLITVRDRMGKICLTKSIKAEDINTTIDMTGYQTGVYFVEIINSENKISRAKLVLIR